MASRVEIWSQMNAALATKEGSGDAELFISHFKDQKEESEMVLALIKELWKDEKSMRRSLKGLDIGLAEEDMEDEEAEGNTSNNNCSLENIKVSGVEFLHLALNLPFIARESLVLALEEMNAGR